MVKMAYVQQRLQALCTRTPIISDVLSDIASHGGTMYLVGGAVRDLVLGIPIVDIDIEVHHVSIAQLAHVLQKYAEVDYVGKAYGVLKLRDRRYGHIDWSIPRHDTAGRKPEVALDPDMGVKQALIRRDITMNAMALNMHTGELEDPFHGYQDALNGVLRTPDPDFFVEDPLRFYRVMQFIGRFDMWPDEQLNNVCTRMDISTVAIERIDGEMEKLLMKSRRPSQAWRWLAAIGRLHEVAPEVAALQGVEQSPYYHPEGDVFVHTMQVIDAAVYSVLPECNNRLVLMYAALCHDLGKPEKTQIADDGRISSHGHEEAGVAPTKRLLHRFTKRSHIHKMVPKLVKHHMAPGLYGRHGTRTSRYKLLAAELAPEISLYLLSVLCYADHRGRNGYSNAPLARNIHDIDTFIETARKAGVLFEPEPRCVTGDDVLDLVEQGPNVGKLVRKAYDIQLRENIHDPHKLKQRAYAWLIGEEKD